MEYELRPEQFNELTKRLDHEVQEALRERLQRHREITIDRRKLNALVIFAVYTDHLRIEILSAFIPVTWKNNEKCVISSSRVKFFCNRYWIRRDKPSWWHTDVAFGEHGTMTYCVDPMDVDGVHPFADMVAGHILQHLSPAFA